mmetsp:Transcript_634/g.1476  ORF Transcript_634/g.1476 Transcript_634/m.1476 type:complete len:95 (-) Transcript_634:684-968(-)
MYLCMIFGGKGLLLSDPIEKQASERPPSSNRQWVVHRILRGASCRRTCRLILMATICTLLEDMDRLLHLGLGTGRPLEFLTFLMLCITLGCQQH